MKINKIKVNAYGKLKDKELELGDNINIIYGKNETGKSTLLSFITKSFYGISKNKNGKEISDFEKYIPWVGEEFSGKIEYELDNQEKFKVFRDFKKKNPQIFNNEMEDISKEFNVDKNKGNEFFYEQTKVDETLFLSTVLINQQEIKLEKQEQNVLIQKLANLVGTGDDNVSYKRAIDRMNRRQLEEIGTQRSREKPINIIEKNIENLRDEKEELIKYENLKYEIEKDKNQLNQEIIALENRDNYLKEIKLLNENQKIEEEKIGLKENIKKENLEKIELLKNKIDEVKNNNKDILEKYDKMSKRKEEREIKEFNKKIILFLVIILMINIIQFLVNNNKILSYLFFLTIPICLVVSFILKNKLSKKIKMREKEENERVEKYEQINIEINNLNSQISLWEKDNNKLEKELKDLKINFNLKLNTEKEKINNKYANSIEISTVYNLQDINYEIQDIQNKISHQKIKLHTLDLDQKNIEPRLENLSKIEEDLENNENKMLNLKKLEESINLAKEVLDNAYEKMKSTVTPKFTQQLSKAVKEITDAKYSNVQLNDDTGLMIELENGSYMPVSRLSVGTIDQLYLSLRLAMVEELSEERMPIILDEPFAYYDSERLKNVLHYIAERFREHQIIIFTCTNREKEILQESNLQFNFIEI